MAKSWPLSISRVLGESWQIVKKEFFVIWMYLLVGLVLPMVPNIIRGVMDLRGILGIILYWLGVILSMVMSYGVIKVLLKLVDEKRPSWQDYWSVFPRLVSIFLTSVLYVAIVLAGMLLLIVPGIIWSIKYQYAIYLAIDKGLGPMAALKASARITDGLKWDIFAFGIVVQIASMLGFLALLVGALWTIPLAMVAQTMYYRRLSQNAGE